MFTCAICGKMVANRNIRPASRTKQSNYIMLVSLSLSGQMDLENALTAAERITAKNRICAMHMVTAAQYLLAEMVVMGSTVVCYDNLGGNVRSAYVNIGDIPEELVSALNRCAKDSAQYVTAKDVGNFINGVLQRFYSTSFWPLNDQDNTARDVDRDSDPNNGEVKLFENKEHQQLTDASPGMSTDDLERDYEQDCIPMSSSSPSFKGTDPTALNQYYLVQGKLLVQLFIYCPHCGNRLNNTELNGVGTAAIVKFVCNACGRVQQWESQERTVAHNKKRTYKGNKDAVVAAISTGLRYVELRQWAKMLNLAFFSKEFFTKFVK